MNSGKFKETDYRHLSEFRRRLRLFLRFSEEQARANGITPQQHLVLAVTRGHPDYPQVAIGALADALQLRQSSTSLLVDRCVKRGLLHRQEDPRDRRRVIVWLTEEGQSILDRVTDANREAARDAALSDAVAQAFIEHMPDAVGQSA